MTPLSPGTRASKLLAVARSIPGPFTRDFLVLEAWRLHPALFGLPGYYLPDSRKVDRALRRLLQRGLVRRRGNLFRAAGRR